MEEQRELPGMFQESSGVFTQTFSIEDVCKGRLLHMPKATLHLAPHPRLGEE